MSIRTQFSIQLGGGIANLVLLVLLTPVLIDVLGLSRYGVLLIVLGLTIYIGLAEFGIGTAVAQRIALTRLSAERSSIFGIALAASVGLGALAGSMFSLVALPGAGTLLGLDAGAAGELAAAGPALFLLGFVVVIGATPRGVLHGLSRFPALNIIGLFSTASGVLAPAVCAVLISRQLGALILAVALAHLAAFAVGLALCMRAGLWPRIGRRPIRLLGRLLAYGGWNTLTGVLHRVSNSLDRPLIGVVAGAGWVAFFAVPQGLLARSNIVAGALTSTVFPRLAATSDTAERARLASICYRSVCLLAPVYSLGILLLPDLLALWLGSDFAAEAAAAAILLALAFWIEAIGAVPYMMLQAAGLMRRDAAVAACIIVPNLVLLVPALLIVGVEGAALVAVLRSLAYLTGRVWATRGEGFPLFDVSLQSALVLATVIAAIGERPLPGAAIFVVSLMVAILRGPSSVDKFLSALPPVRSILRPRGGAIAP